MLPHHHTTFTSSAFPTIHHPPTLRPSTAQRLTTGALKISPDLLWPPHVPVGHHGDAQTLPHRCDGAQVRRAVAMLWSAAELPAVDRQQGASGGLEEMGDCMRRRR